MKTPLKEGIGKYTKGKAFQLRSGNNPSGFKMMGSSDKNDATSTASDADVITGNNNEEPKVNKFATIANKVGNTLVGAFTSGLDAVYGRGKVIPGDKIKFHDPKEKDKDSKTTEEIVDNKIKS
jgi:hypothetical protein